MLFDNKKDNLSHGEQQFAKKYDMLASLAV